MQRQLIGVGTMLERSNVLPHPDDVFLSTPEIRGGVACFAGTRVGVSQLLGYLRDGHTIDDFLSDFPTVKKAQAQFAIERIDNEYVRPSSGHVQGNTGRRRAFARARPVRVLVDECLSERVGDVLGRMRPEHEFASLIPQSSRGCRSPHDQRCFVSVFSMHDAISARLGAN